MLTGGQEKPRLLHSVQFQKQAGLAGAGYLVMRKLSETDTSMSFHNEFAEEQ